MRAEEAQSVSSWMCPTLQIRPHVSRRALQKRSSALVLRGFHENAVMKLQTSYNLRSRYN